MAWVGIPYELIAPDGTRAVFGNSDAAKADPDYIGTLNPESGIVGLLDTASVRESSTDLVERDGASFGSFWLSRRSGTFEGLLRPDLLDGPTVAAAEAKLKRASRALRGDAILRWTPPDDSSPRQLRVRRQDGPRITGRRPKAWQITLESADPYVLSATEQHAVIVAGAAAGEVGILDPVTDPISSALNATGQSSIINAGNAPTWPRFRVTGPITNPTIYRQGVATLTNEVTNPSFENDVAGYAATGWGGVPPVRSTAFASVGTASVLMTTNVMGAGGQNALQILGPSTIGAAVNAWPFSAGRAVSAAAVFNMTSHTGNGVVCIQVNFIDSAGAFISATAGNLINTLGAQRSVINGAIAPAGTAGIIAFLIANEGSPNPPTSQITSYADAVQLHRDVSVCPAYADGSFAGWGWTGTPHASTSQTPPPAAAQQIVLGYSLGAGEYLDIYPQRGAILAQGTADRYSALNFALSNWWQLQPGANDVRLLASGFSSPAALDIYWQNAFE